MSSVFDPIRKVWLKKTPEEEVRQRLLLKMTQHLGFPKGLLSIEKELASLVKLPFDPERRADIVCFFPQTDELKPLLLIECKAFSIREAAVNQAFGYNHLIGAPFLCLAGPLEEKTFWQEGEQIRSIEFLPSYAQLIKAYEASLLF